VCQSSAAFPKNKIKEKLIIQLKLKKIYYIYEIHLQRQREGESVPYTGRLLEKKKLLASFYTDEHTGVILVMYMRHFPVIWKLHF